MLTVSVDRAGRDGGRRPAGQVRALCGAWPSPWRVGRTAAVLLAHTPDDQAETVLLGLARGSGPRSIAGMRAWRPPWGRPLLGVRRSDTEQTCRRAGLTPWQDPHNSDPAFTRVRLRREVLPLLEDVLGGGVRRRAGPDRRADGRRPGRAGRDRRPASEPGAPARRFAGHRGPADGSRSRSSAGCCGPGRWPAVPARSPSITCTGWPRRSPWTTGPGRCGSPGCSTWSDRRHAAAAGALSHRAGRPAGRAGRAADPASAGSRGGGKLWIRSTCWRSNHSGRVVTGSDSSVPNGVRRPARRPGPADRPRDQRGRDPDRGDLGSGCRARLPRRAVRGADPGSRSCRPRSSNWPGRSPPITLWTPRRC